MRRARWVIPAVLIPLLSAYVLAASPVAAQTPATISVDDDTPNAGQTVNVTTTCPGPAIFQSVNVTIFTTPPIAGAATPPLFISNTGPSSTFPLTFNVAANFTIRATCVYGGSGPAPSADLNLTVTEAPTEPTTTIAPTTTAAPATTTVLPDTTAAPTTTGSTSPTTAAVSPTSAANATTDPGQLPATGGSDSTALLAVVLLGLGALVLVFARRSSSLDE